MPSQKQLKWSELRVGITVIIASVILAVLLLLMSGTTGLFTRKITLKSYFDNAGGVRVGAPVRLSGVDIGNDRVAARLSLAWRRVFYEGDPTNMFRFVAGIVIRK